MADRRRYSSVLSDDDYDDYSDDFSDDDPTPVRSAPEKQRARAGRGRNPGRGRGRGKSQGRQSQARSDTQVDVVTKRLLSASRLKMNELQNKLEEMKRELKDVKDENKLYKRLQHKQEKALVKFEDRESELPQMIQAHNNEVRSLREQLRRTKEKYEKSDRYLRDAEDELERVTAKAKKYKALSDEKELAERSDLDRRLNKAELAIEEKECRVKELERHMEHLKKNHRHELGIERARCRETQRQLDDLKDTNSRLDSMLKEKEKLLEARNIYSNRMSKPSSYNGTPVDSPAPWRQSLKKKSESMSDLAPRNKARAYEEKRKAEEKKKDKPVRKQEPKQKWEDEDLEKEREDNRESTSGPNIMFKSLQREDSEADFWRRQEQRYKQDKDNREKQEEERRKKDEEREQAKFQQQRQKMQRDLEERERKERERREADERERKEQERKEQERKERERLEQERRDKEEKERQDGERREREQRERDKKEREQKMKEEQERLDNDPRLAEERKKKDELLRRLQVLDGNRDGSQPSSDPFAPSDSTTGKSRGDIHSDLFASSPSKKATTKDLFSPNDRDRTDSFGNKKEYNFKRSVENMHNGKPAQEVSMGHTDRQKKGKGSTNNDDGGYMPSFLGPSKPTSNTQKKPLSLFDDDVKAATNNADKKSKLMADLFGAQPSVKSSSPSKNDDNGDDFFLTKKSPPPKQQTQPKKSQGFPWDGPTSTTQSNGSANPEASTLFGGGAALVDDDAGGGGSKSTLLPRRPRQNNTAFSSKPAMVTVDSLDDDIEEVIL